MKLKLMLLLAKYKYEISKGNTEHLKDAIAIMVLLDLARFDISEIEDMNINKITLKKLMSWYLPSIDTSTCKFRVPTIDQIKILQKKYKKDLKHDAISYDVIHEKAATTWIEMMLIFDMIEEGQTIYTDQYVLSDFITDKKLKSMFEGNDESITYYIIDLKK